MSSSSAQPRGVRIGDAERDAAVERLREHMVAGRLSVEEFDERVGRAVAARTQADLDPLFADLPRDPDAVGGVSVWRAPTPPAQDRGKTLRTIQRWMIVVTPVVVVLWVLGVAHLWAILVVWIVAFVLLGRAERALAQVNRSRRDDRPRSLR